jgi:hypothetical protein
VVDERAAIEVVESNGYLQSSSLAHGSTRRDLETDEYCSGVQAKQRCRSITQKEEKTSTKGAGVGKGATEAG